MSDTEEAEVMRQDNDPKNAAKATKAFYRPKHWNVVDWPSQSPDFSQLEYVFLLLKTRPQVKSSRNKHKLIMAAVKARQSIPRRMYGSKS